MYEVYYYTPTAYRSRTYYNIRDTTNNKTTGCRISLADTLISSWEDNHEVLSVHYFEQTYNCKLLFTTPTLTDLINNYPEYFI